ncbi:MAG: hypothetical protein DCF16_08180 [Alphaproteobacteria bacterium]|nr:MAG: hypothetical protein DCF16_08180 [Alphaproteobacteria bacterium]
MTLHDHALQATVNYEIASALVSIVPFLQLTPVVIDHVVLWLKAIGFPCPALACLSGLRLLGSLRCLLLFALRALFPGPGAFLSPLGVLRGSERLLAIKLRLSPRRRHHHEAEK